MLVGLFFLIRHFCCRKPDPEAAYLRDLGTGKAAQRTAEKPITVEKKVNPAEGYIMMNDPDNFEGDHEETEHNTKDPNAYVKDNDQIKDLNESTNEPRPTANFNETNNLFGQREDKVV